MGLIRPTDRWTAQGEVVQAENRDLALRQRLQQLPVEARTVCRSVSPIQLQPTAAATFGFSPSSRQLCRVTSPISVLQHAYEGAGGEDPGRGNRQVATDGERAAAGATVSSGSGRNGGSGNRTNPPPKMDRETRRGVVERLDEMAASQSSSTGPVNLDRRRIAEWESSWVNDR